MSIRLIVAMLAAAAGGAQVVSHPGGGSAGKQNISSLTGISVTASVPCTLTTNLGLVSPYAVGVYCANSVGQALVTAPPSGMTSNTVTITDSSTETLIYCNFSGVATTNPSQGSASCDTTLTALPLLPGGTHATAFGLSADGATVAGVGDCTGCNGQGTMARWTRGAGSASLGTLGGTSSDNSWAHGISADGSTVVGANQDAASTVKSVKWTQSDGIVEIAPFSGVSEGPGSFYYAESFAANSDGSVIVGDTTNNLIDQCSTAFVWTQADGTVPLDGTTAPNVNSLCDDESAQGVSSDGTVITGYSTFGGSSRHSARWTSGTGWVDLGIVPGAGAYNLMRAISGDGSTLVGATFNADSSASHAIKWVSGTFTDLGGPGLESNSATAANQDGSVIVGNWDHGCFIWTQARGMRDLATVLGAAGVDLSGVVLQSVAGVSGDGKTLAGTATFGGVRKMFIAANVRP